MAQLAIVRQMSRKVSRSPTVEYQAYDKAGVTRLSWRVSGRRAGRFRMAQLATLRQMSREVSQGSAGNYQANEQAGVARLRWGVSGR